MPIIPDIMSAHAIPLSDIVSIGRLTSEVSVRLWFVIPSFAVVIIVTSKVPTIVSMLVSISLENLSDSFSDFTMCCIPNKIGVKIDLLGNLIA